MSFFSYSNSMKKILLLQTMVFHSIITPGFLTHEIDPETKSFIQIICNQTRNKDTCETIFTQNLSDPKSDPLSLTRRAIEITLTVLNSNVDDLQGEKNKVNSFRDEEKSEWELLEICQGVYRKLIMGVEEIQKECEIKNMKSMSTIGESFGKLQKLANYEMLKCEILVENNLFDDLSLVKIISEKNYIVGLLIEIVVSAGEKLVKVLDVGVEEVESHYGFLQFLLHG